MNTYKETSKDLCVKKNMQAIPTKKTTNMEHWVVLYNHIKRLHLCIYIHTCKYKALNISISKSTSSVPPQTLEPYEINYVIYPSKHFKRQNISILTNWILSLLDKIHLLPAHVLQFLMSRPGILHSQGWYLPWKRLIGTSKWLPK